MACSEEGLRGWGSEFLFYDFFFGLGVMLSSVGFQVSVGVFVSEQGRNCGL